MSHQFGDLLRQYCARKRGLSQTRLAHMIGYDQAVLVRMSQGKKDLTGPSGRERVILIIGALRDEGVLTTQGEANALLRAAGMPPLYEGQPAELALLQSLTVLTALTAEAVLHPPPQVPATPPASNLPAQLTRFIGREQEMADVTHLLATTRLLTLTGSGGCGKTRLAIEVGASFVGATGRSPRPGFGDGVWLVEFAALTERRLVADTVAAALGLRAMSRTSLALLIDFLADKQALLILDNCEHLIQGCAELALALLQACPQLQLFATSREPLNVPGEATWRVPPLAPDDAARLFVERAQAARPDFVLTPANIPALAQICRRLDSMPLALELAAARLRAFSVEQIAARLDDAFRVLTGGSRTALPRQQTLRATIDWSYALLAEDERTLLRELSVFAGGWTLEAAEAVYGAGAAELLEQLVNKSLVVAEQRDEESSTSMRYHLLETIRQYARDALRLTGAGAESEAHQRHLDYFASLEQSARPHISAAGPERKSWVDIVVPEVDNLRVALGWAAQHEDWQTGQRLIYCVGSVWGGPAFATELSKWLDVLILSNPAASDTARVAGLLMMANNLGGSGDMDGYVDWARKASALAHRIGEEDLVLECDAKLGGATPDHAEAAELLNRILQHAQQTGRKLDEVRAIQALGTRMSLQGQCRQSAILLEQGTLLARQVGIHSAQVLAADFPLAGILWRLGQAYLECGDYTRARGALEESFALTRDSGLVDAEALVDLGTIGVYTGDYNTARQALREGFADFYNRDNLERVAQTLVLAAGLAQALGKLEQAARLLGVAAAIRRDHHTHGVFERELFAEYDRRLPAVQAAMDPMAFEQAWAEGQTLTLKEAMAGALAL